MRHHPAPSAARRHQRGVYAVEYALVFTLFFGIVYSLVCYGLLVGFRLGLQNAAEDGARAALRHQPTLEARRVAAENVARARTTGWLPLSANVAASVAYQTAGVCGDTLAQRCRMVVTIDVPGLPDALPPFPGFALPQSIHARASVLLDGRAL